MLRTSLRTLVFLSAAVLTAAAQPSYVTIDIPGATNTFANAINNRGQVAGGYGMFGSVRGFIQNPDGTITSTSAPGAPITILYGLNQYGPGVGQYFDGFVLDRGFLRLPDDSYMTIEPVPFVEGGAFGINNLNQIVGAWSDQAPFLNRGFLWVGGDYAYLDYPGALDCQPICRTVPESINDLGQIVGFYQDAQAKVHGFIYDVNGWGIFDVPFPDAIRTFGHCINNAGQIGGYYEDQNHHTHGFFWDGSHFIRLDVPQATDTQLNGINDNGQGVGTYTGQDGHSHGFLVTFS